MAVFNAVMRRAALGDVATLHIHTATPIVVDGTPQVRECTQFLVSLVTDVRSNGAVAAVADPLLNHDPNQPSLPLADMDGVEKVFVVPHERIDVEAALAAVRAQTPSARFDTLAQVTKVINRYRH